MSGSGNGGRTSEKKKKNQKLINTQKAKCTKIAQIFIEANARRENLFRLVFIIKLLTMS
jgi:hypothetical protein